MNSTITVNALVLFAAALAGCAGSSDAYPSLTIRDAERMTGTLSPAAPVSAPVPSVQTIASVEAALDLAQSMHSRFIATRPQVAALTASARGRGQESDARAKALIALAELTSLHSETALALADLDRMEVDAATQFAALDDIRSAQARIQALVMDQDLILDTLWLEIDG